MSTTLGLKSCCISGVLHEGTPTGQVKEINGTRAYVALPTSDYDKTKAVLFLPDIFGLELVNAQLVADSFAANGFATYIPDYLNGDPVGPNQMGDKSFSLPEWFKTHGPTDTRPPLDLVIEGLKKEGVTDFGATGYCFGARYVVDLAYDNVIKAGVVAHPSLLVIPDDLQKIKDTVKIPILWNIAEKDYNFSPKVADEADKILGESPLYKRIDYPETEHGFAVRGDLSIPAVKEGKELAFKNTVDWFKAHL
ncbi:alpha/beta-hydrolase [Meredithblackwellia eburnea MCA 4105]